MKSKRARARALAQEPLMTVINFQIKQSEKQLKSENSPLSPYSTNGKIAIRTLEAQTGTLLTRLQTMLGFGCPIPSHDIVTSSSTEAT